MTKTCPYCGKEATDESIRKRNLSKIGYLHEDIQYQCSNPECKRHFILGVPKGEYESDTWICDVCGGDYIPHFLHINLSDKTIETRPKCQDCFHAPNEYIEILSKFHGENIRGFFGHHTITGDRDVESDPI